MARFTLGFLAGLVVVMVSTLALWVTLPFVLSGLSSGKESWLGWFPFAIFIPALLLGGFTAARFVHVRRATLGFAVGLVATAAAGLLARGSAHVLFLFMVLFIGGGLGALGAYLSGKHAVSP